MTKNKESGDAGETEGARGATGVAPAGALSADRQPNPEVSDRPQRRRFTAAYKLKIFRQIEKCTEPGQVGALLRREGLFSSTVSGWRRQRERGELNGLMPKKRGRKAKPKDPRDKVISEQHREIKNLERKLAQAETVIDIQKKVSSLLGIPLKNPDDEEST